MEGRRPYAGMFLVFLLLKIPFAWHSEKEKYAHGQSEVLREDTDVKLLDFAYRYLQKSFGSF